MTNIEIINDEISTKANALCNDYGVSKKDLALKFYDVLQNRGSNLVYLDPTNYALSTTIEKNGWLGVLFYAFWNNKSIKKLKEVLEILKIIESEFNEPNQNVKISSNNIRNENNTSLRVIRVGFFSHLDGYLPFLFQFAYSRNLNISYIPIDSWGHCIDAFKEGKIDMAIHSFPTSLIPIENDNLTFIPLYTYNGYSSFVNDISFNEKTTEKRAEFIKKAKIYVELRTELEFILEKYLATLNLKRSDVTIINEGINNGKIKFLQCKEEAFYLTNLENDVLFTDNCKKNLAISKVDLAHVLKDFKNFNGLICPKSFVNGYLKEIDEFLNTWFRTIVLLKKTLNEYPNIKIDKNKKHLMYMYQGLVNIYNQEKESVHDIIDTLQKEKTTQNPIDTNLNFEKTELTLSDLIRCYSNPPCYFFNNETEAFEAFNREVVESQNSLETNKIIAKIQAGDPDKDLKIDSKIMKYKEFNN